MSDPIAVAEFQSMIASKAEDHVRGYMRLYAHWGFYQKHCERVTQYWDKLHVTVDYINGVHRGRPLSIYKSQQRKQRKLAQKFFETLSTPLLRQQAELYDIDYDAYDTVDAIIAALIDHHVGSVVSTAKESVTV